MAQWLLNRLFNAKEQPKPRFAFQGTVNWMRALAILVGNGEFHDEKLKAHYGAVSRRKPNHEADTFVFEKMMMAFHNQASLVRLVEDISHPYDICRAAIISWYYSTYFTCSAMVAGASGSLQETHAYTAKVWQADIVDSALVVSPFSLCVSSLVEKVAEAEILAYRGANPHDLNTRPQDAEQAWGAAVSYLNGTWDYEKWRIEERVKGDKSFKALGVDNFRTKAARELRDNQLAKHGVNYLVQAFRYRGKANYRDSIFLSYGDDNSEKMESFIQDLEGVSRAFQRMAAFYLSRRVEKGTWAEFVADLEANSRLSLDANYLAV
jgi:hypothetical protein